MKLSRRVLLPIVLISFLAVAFCGFFYYEVMYQRIEELQRKEVQATLHRLEDEMNLTNSTIDLVTDRDDQKNLSLARSVARCLAMDPDTYMQTSAMQELAAEMGIDMISVVGPTGAVAGTHQRHIDADPNSYDEYTFILDIMAADPDFALALDPEVNSEGVWMQYYFVPRLDDEGFIALGIEYSITTILDETFTDGINANIAGVGETGHVEILHGSTYAAHPDESKIGHDVSGAEWYGVVASEQTGINELAIDGETYLVGHKTYEDGTTLLALLPVNEYRVALSDMRYFTFALVMFTCLIIVAVAVYSVHHHIMQPLGAVNESMKRLGRGQYETADIEGKFYGEMEQLRQDVNRTIAQLKGRLDSVLPSYPGVIWSCNSEFICTLSAGQAMEVMEYDPKFYLGRNLLEAVRETGDEETAVMIEKTFTEGPQRIHKEFSGRYLSMTTSQIHDKAGNVIGMVGVGADVTDMRLLQQQLIETTKQAQMATDEARRASDAKSDFLSRMSHEIRTPMNAIIGMSTIAKKSDDPKKILYCLEKIQAASNQMLRLINDILDMSKIEANKFELSETEFDFEDMLQSVCNVVEANTTEKRQDFIIDFSEVFERNVIADELRLSQVLINLLNNAVKFTPDKGQITLKIRCEDKSKSPTRLFFDVIDTGIGISEEQQKHLFASFEQGDGSITRRYGGTGLGLAISKNIIGLMGGQIELESEPGFGSKFSFSVNIKWGNEKHVELEGRLPLGDNRILVIDDSPDVCLYFEHILGSFHLECDTANSGQAGMKKVTAAIEENRPYRLILIDWRMPGMDGTETARQIKTLTSPETIVSMISVADWSDIEQDAKSVGVEKFLPKPVLPTVLFQSIVGWLNSSESEKAAAAEIEIQTMFRGKRMLVADDIDINREIIISMLEDTGMEVVSADSGQNALDIYLADPKGFDVILMDIQMPGIDGYQATRELRASGVPGCDSVPILAMTANAFVSDVEKSLAAGMNGHIAKPVDMNDMFAKILAALGNPCKPGQPVHPTPEGDIE